MVNGIDKKALFKLASEPYLKPISDLGVGFYNLDENTAKIEFQLYNSKGPLLISENNINAYAYFESTNGSASDVIDLEILDGLNGIVGITLDKEFLQASTDTNVKGQVYVGVNNVDDNPKNNEVAVFREFTFQVADALINKISSFTKVENIRMFSQLKAQIKKDVVDIQEAIANGSDYVAEMKRIKSEAISEISTVVMGGRDYIDQAVEQSQATMNELSNSTIRDINREKDNVVSAFNSKVAESNARVENKSNDAMTHVDTKISEFNEIIESNGFVQPTDLDNKLNELTWQKYKLTHDDGSLKSLDYSVVDLFEVTTGIYELKNVSAIPGNKNLINGTAFIQNKQDDRSVEIYLLNGIDIYYIFLTAGLQNQNWKKLTYTQIDTGWIPFQLINGALSNTAYKGTSDGGFDCAYRTITNGSETKRLLRLNGSKLTHNSVIAQLPSNFCKNAQSFPIRVPIGTTWFGAFIVIRPSGEVRFLINGEYSNWNDTGYTYGQFEWTD